MIHAVVFDFDGVLADSEPLHLRAYQEVFSGLGVTLHRDEYYSRYLGFADDAVFTMVAEAYGWQLTPTQVESLIEEKAIVFDAMLAGADVLYPGAAECVERLARDFPLGIASGALRHEIVAILERYQLAGHFRFIVAAGDTPASKPSPDPYRRAAALHGVVPDACMAIEDSRWGIESAKTAGLRCIGITNTYPASELDAADATISTLAEFTREFIKRFRGSTRDGSEGRSTREGGEREKLKFCFRPRRNRTVLGSARFPIHARFRGGWSRRNQQRVLSSPFSCKSPFAPFSQ